MSLLKRIEKKEPTNGSGSVAQPSNGGSAPQPPAAEPVRQRQTPAPPTDKLTELRGRLLTKIIAELDPKLDVGRADDLRRSIEEHFNQCMAEEPDVVLGRIERQRLLEQLAAEIMGFGPLEPLLRDNSIDEIMVNGPNMIYIERQGKIERVAARFDSEMHVYRIIDRIVAPLGRRVDEGQPFVDARLPNGSRVNVIIPPLALNGPTITIRKFASTPLTAEDLVKRASFTNEFIEFMKASVKARLNIIVSGGTGTGKTTMLNVFSSYIPNDERIITIEDAAELQLRQEHVISLESRPKNIEGKGEITRGDLVINALRMRPDRILVGECRSSEALDMLQAMNTGHEGSMTTIHANSPRDSLHRLETMVLMAGYDLPLKAIREQISSAIDIIVQLDRMRDGTRKVTNVSEVQGMEGDVIITQEVFRWESGGIKDGKVLGSLRPTGIRPKFIERVEALGIYLPPNIFGVDPRFYQ